MTLFARTTSYSAVLFDENLGNDFFFNGADNSYLKITNSANLNMSSLNSDGNFELDSFTISWWQKTSYPQIKFPRIFSFGEEGAENPSTFSVSEENDGNMYLWINSINIFSMPIPPDNQWNHISVSYNKSLDEFSWYLNGNLYGSPYQYFSGRDCGEGLCIPKYAVADTSNLDIFIGGNNDPITGGFLGEIGGFQIYKGVRWSGNFEPPTNFLNPSGMQLSLYVGSTGDASQRFIDKSSNNLAITSFNVPWQDFILDPSPDPSPSVTPTPDPTPTVDPSPDPSPSVTPTPDPTPSFNVHVTLNNSDYGKVSFEKFAYSEETHSYSEIVDSSYMQDEITFSVTYEILKIYIVPESGYGITDYTINGERSYDVISWDEDELMFFDSDPLYENIEINVNLAPILRTSIFPMDSNFNNYLYFAKPDDSAPYNYNNVKHVSVSIPVSYVNESGILVNDRCFIDLSDDFSTADEFIEVFLPWFGSISQDFPEDCVGTDKFGRSYSDILPEYQIQMFGESEVAASFYLWEQEEVLNYSDVRFVKEQIPYLIKLPPELSFSDISRNTETTLDSSKIRFEDSVEFELYNPDSLLRASIFVQVPEAYSDGSTPNPDNWCEIQIPIEDILIDVHSKIKLPSEDDFLSSCRSEFDGDWNLNRNINHGVDVVFWDEDYNYSKYLSYALFLEPSTTFESIESIPDPEPVSKENSTKPIVTNFKPSNSKVTKCSSLGIWIYTKSGSLKVCNSKKQIVYNIAACTGKASTPTYPWTYKPKKFRAGKFSARSGKVIYDAIYFYRNLVIAGVDKLSPNPCSKGSILISKNYAKKIFDFAKKYDPTIRVLSR